MNEFSNFSSQPTPSERSNKGLQCVVIVAAIFVLAGLVMLIGSVISFPYESIPFDEISFKEMEDEKLYFVEDAIILDTYASSEDEKEWFFIAITVDKDGMPVYFSVEAPSKDMEKEWKKGIQSETDIVTVSGYIFTEPWSDQYNNMYSLFSQAAVKYDELLFEIEYETALPAHSEYDSRQHSRYVCNEDDNLTLSLFSFGSGFYIIFSSIIILISGAVLAIAIIADQKEKRRRRRQANLYFDPYYTQYNGF